MEFWVRRGPSPVYDRIEACSAEEAACHFVAHVVKDPHVIEDVWVARNSYELGAPWEVEWVSRGCYKAKRVPDSPAARQPLTKLNPQANSVRPSPVVGYRWCERGERVDVIIRRDHTWISASLPETKAGGKQHGSDGYGGAISWPRDPRLAEAEAGDTTPRSSLHRITGIGVSAEPQPPPPAQDGYGDEDWI